jgi:hypothetical protein
MEKIVGVLSLAVLTAMVWTYEVPAASWDFIYEGDKLPDPLEWEIYKTDGVAVSDVCEITPAGELHITDPNDKVCFFLPAVDSVEKGTIEVRVKALSQSGATYTILFGIEDEAVDAWVDLFPDHIQLEAGESYSLDMTEYHILRIAKDGSDATVYVDDEMVIEGPIGSAADDRQDNIIFGSGSTGGTGEHYWDYVVYTSQGAFSPEELPNFLSTMAVESEGKAATCWGMLKSQ